MTLMPRESAKLIAGLSKNVLIEQEGVKNLSCVVLEGLKDRKIDVKNFSQASLHPRPEDPRAIDWIFMLDVLNFSFWPSKGTKSWTVKGESGYYALCAAIKRAKEEEKPILDSKYYANINQSDFEYIFRGDEGSGPIPLMKERIENLREAGQVLNNKYQGTFVECVKSCSGSAEGLLKLIVNEFKSFRDEATYEGHKVSFYKRAQILVGDIWACFEGKNIGAFHDVDYLTMFPDYRIPQVLLHFGTIRYSNLLLSKLQSDIELEAGSIEETEIRGCSVEVVERVKDEVQNLILRYPELGLNKSDCNSVVIDHFLWDYRRAHAEELEHIPFHKTRTIFY